MKSYEDFYSWVAPDAPGCPELSIVNEVRNSCIQFCERTLIHQVDLDPVTVVAGLVDYDLESPQSQTRVHKIMRAWFQRNLLEPAAPDMINDPTGYNQRIGGVTVDRAEPKYYFQKDAASFSLLPIPDQTVVSGVTMRVALAPLRNSTSCAEFLFENWVETIASGALARLLSSQGKAYFNPTTAVYHQQQFMVGVNDARQTASRGYTRSNLSVKFRRI